MHSQRSDNSEISWVLATGAEHLRTYLAAERWREDGTVVKRNRKRTVVRVPPGSVCDRGFYVKHEHPTNPRDLVKALWRCKAQQEFEAGLALAEAGVPVVPMLAWGRTGWDGFLVTGELPGVQPFMAAWHRAEANSEQRASFVRAVAAFLRTLLAARVVHPDMHVGNVVATRGSDALALALIDVYGVRAGARLSAARRSMLLAWLAVFLVRLTDAERADFLRQAMPETEPTDVNAAWRRIRDAHARAARSKWRGRRRRLLKASSRCQARRTPTGRWLLLSGLDTQAAESAVAHHDQNVASGRNVLKNDVKRRVSRVTVDDRAWVVKEFRRPGPWGAWRSDCRSWLNTHRLRALNVRAADCRGWLRARDGRGFLVLEDVGDECLYHALRDRAESLARRPIIRAAARVVAQLHDVGIAHSDLKQANFMLKPDTQRPDEPFTLIDSDAVTFRRCVTAADRRRNLEQVWGTFPPTVGRLERVRFLAYYRRAAGLSLPVLRALVD